MFNRLTKEYNAFVEFKALSDAERSIVFYAENSCDWLHLEPVIEELTTNFNQQICYITSDYNDSILKKSSPLIKSFYIGSGTFRTILFRQIKARVIVMTLTDLGNYYLKRSLNPSHYVYVFHSINSTHLAYRKNAFKNYDTIFCVGPHHIDEIRKTEKIYNLKPKSLIEHGYGRLDSILKAKSQILSPLPGQKGSKTILIAPSWGENLITNTCAEYVVKILLDAGHQVIFRPHPMSIRLSRNSLKKLNQKFKNNARFKYITDLNDPGALLDSDIMLSDFSGAATEFAFGLEKPVVFIDFPGKIFNPEYKRIHLPAIEVFIRKEIGSIIKLKNLRELPEKVTSVLNNHSILKESIKSARGKWVFNIGSSGNVGAKAILDILNKEPV